MEQDTEIVVDGRRYFRLEDTADLYVGLPKAAYCAEFMLLLTNLIPMGEEGKRELNLDFSRVPDFGGFAARFLHHSVYVKNGLSMHRYQSMEKWEDDFSILPTFRSVLPVFLRLYNQRLGQAQKN